MEETSSFGVLSTDKAKFHRGSIEAEIESGATLFPPVERRYYTRKFFSPPSAASKSSSASGDVRQDHMVSVHSNKICLVSISREHAIVKDCLKVERVEATGDRLNSTTSGKGKRGATPTEENTILAWATCSNGEKRVPMPVVSTWRLFFFKCSSSTHFSCRFALRGCIRGKLIEINRLVVECPQLLAEKPYAEGHFAVILPNKGNAACTSHLVSEDEYLMIDKNKAAPNSLHQREPSLARD